MGSEKAIAVLEKWRIDLKSEQHSHLPMPRGSFADVLEDIVAILKRLDDVEREARFCSRCGYDKANDPKATP